MLHLDVFLCKKMQIRSFKAKTIQNFGYKWHFVLHFRSFKAKTFQNFVFDDFIIFVKKQAYKVFSIYISFL